MLSALPSALAELFAIAQTPTDLLTQLMPTLGSFLGCDRCFLYLRDPALCIGRVPFCWVAHPGIPVIYDPAWKPEPDALASEDPLFAAALRTEPSIFVEDVQTAGTEVLNLQFEQDNFGHRALIHSHLCHDDQLWGVLQPCVFGRSRFWTTEERRTVQQVVAQITPKAIEYIKTEAQLTSNKNIEEY